MPAPIIISPIIDQLLQRPDCALALSISGGKDSQALVEAVSHEYGRRGWQATVFAIHADLGRAEWAQLLPMCQKIADSHGLDLIVVQRTKGDLVSRFEQRIEATAGTSTPFWPSASMRYCTSEMKAGPINKHLRQYNLVISAEGIRAQESTARAKKRPLTVRKNITTKRLKTLSPEEALAQWAETENGRLALTWFPILDYSLDDVWHAIGTTQAELDDRHALYRQGKDEQRFDLMHQALDRWPAHPAYVFGNTRVSCVFCVLANKNDLKVGAEQNPELLDLYLDLEVVGDATFKHKQSLADIITS